MICYEHLTDYIAFVQGTIEDVGIGWYNDFTDPQDIARLLAQAPQMQEQYEQVTEARLGTLELLPMRAISLHSQTRSTVQGVRSTTGVSPMAHSLARGSRKVCV